LIKFASTISAADEISSILNKNKIKSVSLHYRVGQKRCQEIFQLFNEGIIQVVVNVLMLNEGYDTQVDCIILGRVTESERVFVQQMGRGLRKDSKNPDKSVCIIDLAMNLRKRWKRLINLLPRDELKNYIKEFWNVENFEKMKETSDETIEF
jgi:superfamily II DNA or RNA helicase